MHFQVLFFLFKMFNDFSSLYFCGMLAQREGVLKFIVTLAYLNVFLLSFLTFIRCYLKLRILFSQITSIFTKMVGLGRPLIILETFANKSGKFL